MLAEAKQGLADINWDVIPFDWANDANTAATRYMLMTQIKPISVVLFHDTYSSTVDLVYQFIPVLKANGYHLVTVSQMVGPREPGTSYGSRDNGPAVNDLTTFRPPRFPRCWPRRRPRRCRTSRSPTSRTRTPAVRTTGLAAAVTPHQEPARSRRAAQRHHPIRPVGLGQVEQRDQTEHCEACA